MTDLLNIGVRLALYANLLLLFGLPLFGLYALKGAERQQDAILPIRFLTGWLSVSGIALSLLSIIAMTASMTGVGLFDVERALVSIMIFETPMGNAWGLRVLALFSTLAAVWLSRDAKSYSWQGLMAGGAAIALASLAWTGHGAAGEGATGTVQLIADIIHLLGAGAWLGALAALVLLLFWRAETMTQEHLRITHRSLAGFSVVGTIIVALVIGSGLVNSSALVGLQNVLLLPTTLYGQLLIAKLVLFGIMLILAATNRFSLTPAFERAILNGGTNGALRRLQISLIVELSLAAAIIGLVAWLGTLEPPMAR